MDKPKLKLCCIVSPITTDDGKLVRCWCVYCGKCICEYCLDNNLVDEWYHHEECKKVCPHTDEFHSEPDEDVQPIPFKEYT